MSDTAGAKPPTQTNQTSITLSLLVWLLVQLAALGLAASRVPLSANFARPAESLATYEMTIVQFIASAMLFPWLLRSKQAWLAMCITAGPMLLLAGILAATPLGTTCYVWLATALWLSALATWRAALPTSCHLPATAVALLVTAGSLLLLYLRSEFGASGTYGVSVRVFPMSALIIALREHALGMLPLLPTLVLLALGALLRLMCKRLRHT